MSEISRRSLFGKLNPLAFKSLQSAADFCKLRGNPYVEWVHWMNLILQQADSDLHRINNHFGIDASRVAADIVSILDKLPRGSTSMPDFSGRLEEITERGWVYGSLMFKESQIRSGHLVVGMLKTHDLRNTLTSVSREFEKIKADTLCESFSGIVSSSPENVMKPTDGSALAASGSASETAGGVAGMGATEALAKYSVDLTAKARAGQLDPILGRDEEIRQIVDILMRRRQNNPILTGEAGVGKTAVVEGFAQRIAAGDVPPVLREVTLRTLDLTLMQAGASMKGEFEQRLRSVIEEVQKSQKPIILFIDEAHTLIGAGGAAGQGDAANLLKPALARGTLRTIAATTQAEYKKYFEKDPALSRRFQVVQVDEPSEAKAVLMLRGLCSVLEKHHRVQLLDEGIEAAVRLSHRYIPARQLPDKAVSLLDTACARVAVGQHSIPAPVEDSRRRIQAWETETEIVNREIAVGLDHSRRLTEIGEKLKIEHKRLKELEDHWAKEKSLVDQVLELRSKLRGAGEPIDPPRLTEPVETPKREASAPVATAPASATTEPESRLSEAERAQLLTELMAVQKELTDFQGENPLVLPAVDAQAVASVVSDWTGIPVGRMARSEIQQVLKLVDTLEKRVIGQRSALEAIAKRVRTSRAKLDNPSRPVGVFMLVGPSGTGKTETALALAEALYGGEKNLIKINMAEFQESHTVSTLKGSPPGYVGYGEGGVLTEAVRRSPYSVVLLDEVEKAHKDVHKIFFEVFDRGHMQDSEGRDIDFRNTIILLTSNAAQDTLIAMCEDPELMPDAEGLEKAMRGPLTKVFPDALLNRLLVVPYYPISKAMLKSIITMQLARVGKRVEENHKAPFSYDESVTELIALRCTELERGARMVEAMITNKMLPEIGEELLHRMAEGRGIKRVNVTAADGKFVYAFD